MNSINKTIGIAMAVLVVSMAATAAFAPEVESGRGKSVSDDIGVKSMSDDKGNGTTSRLRIEDREMIKTALKSHLNSVNHGYGIGISDAGYLTARWQIVSVKTLSMEQIRSMVAQANKSNWSELREELNLRLQQSAIEATKGRIRIGKVDYVLTNIVVTNSTATADIRSMPDYAACSQANVTSENCELNAETVGSMSLEKKTEVFEDSENARVWAGTLDFKGTAYTFVTFAYPRWDA